MTAATDHRNWFNEGLANPDRLQLIATAANGCPIGQIHFERQLLPTENGAAEVSLDLSLDPSARGFGLADDLVRLGLQMMEQTWGPDIEDGTGELIKTKQASNACFCRSGSVQETISLSAPSLSGYESLALPPGRITVLSDRAGWSITTCV